MEYEEAPFLDSALHAPFLAVLLLFHELESSI